MVTREDVIKAKASCTLNAEEADFWRQVCSQMSLLVNLAKNNVQEIQKPGKRGKAIQQLERVLELYDAAME